jgi:hypothetical protein
VYLEAKYIVAGLILRSAQKTSVYLSSRSANLVCIAGTFSLSSELRILLLLVGGAKTSLLFTTVPSSMTCKSKSPSDLGFCSGCEWVAPSHRFEKSKFSQIAYKQNSEVER